MGVGEKDATEHFSLLLFEHKNICLSKIRETVSYFLFLEKLVACSAI